MFIRVCKLIGLAMVWVAGWWLGSIIYLAWRSYR
jgi:hypothetical protein